MGQALRNKERLKLLHSGSGKDCSDVASCNAIMLTVCYRACFTTVVLPFIFEQDVHTPAFNIAALLGRALMRQSGAYIWELTGGI